MSESQFLLLRFSQSQAYILILFLPDISSRNDVETLKLGYALKLWDTEIRLKFHNGHQRPCCEDGSRDVPKCTLWESVFCAAKQELAGIFWSNSSHSFCLYQQYNFDLCVMYMPIIICLQWGYEEATLRDITGNICVEMIGLTHTIFQLSSVFKFKECIAIIFMSYFSKECFPFRKLLTKITKRWK